MARSVLTIIALAVIPHLSQLAGACTTNEECPGELSICLGQECLEACGDWEKCKGKAVCLSGGKCYCRVGLIWDNSKGCVQAECNSNEDCRNDRRCDARRCKDPCIDRCGPNTFCMAFNHEPMCYCQPGYYGNPPNGCTLECGVPQSKTTLIHRGTESSPGDFPWLVALYWSSVDKWEHKCGGTLISPRIVLTAAHCLHENNEIISARRTKVGLGKYFRSFTIAEENSVISDVKAIVVPRHYTGAPGFELDIGLMQLTEDVKLSAFIQPACFWSPNVTLARGNTGYIAGWGTTETGNPSETVLYTKLTYLNYAHCKNLMKESSKELLSHDKFCTVIDNESHADYGDSGGGFTVVRNGRHFVVGLVSTKMGVSTLVDENLKLLTGFTDLTNDENHSWVNDYVTRLSK